MLQIVLKTCGDCKLEKPTSEFNTHYGKPRSQCKVCHSRASGEWNSKNKEHRASYVKNWHTSNVEKVRKHKRKYEENRTTKQIEERKNYLYWRHIRKAYGLTPETFKELLDKQNGVCALCKKPGRIGRNGKFYVDHCHDTGRVRGLVCRPCNTSLDILGDTVEKMEIIMAYLRGPV